MPSFLAFLLLFASTSVLTARRAVKEAASLNAKADLKKCTISWMSKGVASTVSFPVTNCRQGCNVNSDNKYYTMFAPAFVTEQSSSRYCRCKQRGNERRIAFKLVGKCPKDNGVARYGHYGELCFDRYTDIRTETYKALGESSITRVKDLPAKHERKFEYLCDGSAWNLGDAVGIQLPSILEGRDQEELDAFKRVVKKFGEKGRKDLTPEEADLFDAIKDSDDLREVVNKVEEDEADSNPDKGSIEQQVIYQDLASPSKGGDLTVGQLRRKYDDLLKDTGLSVPHLLKVGGLGDKADDEVVTQEMFVKFLEPDCEK